MKTLRQILYILAFTFTGELLHILLPLPIPAAVYGLALLFTALQYGTVQLETVQATGHFLLKLMPVLFIPPAVGLIISWPILSDSWAPVLVIVVVSTVAVFGVSGCVAQILLSRHTSTNTSIDKESHHG